MTLDNQRLTAQARGLLHEVSESRARIQATADEERRRIERDLHDGAQQRLVALRIELELEAEEAERGDAERAATLRRLGADVEEAIDEVRSLARGIYPAALADRGLADALRAAALRSPLPTTVLVTGVGRYSREIETAAYFCCLEALQNAAKHAHGASAAVIELSDDGMLRVEVRDDGAGFDVASVEHGSGLVNMRDRLSAVGASSRWSRARAGARDSSSRSRRTPRSVTRGFGVRASLRRRPPADTLVVSHRERSTTMLRGRREQRREERETFGRGGNATVYQVREKTLSIGDDLWIENDAGEKVFKVNGKALRVRKTLVFEDTEGRELCKIQGRVVRVRDSMEVESPDGDRIAMIKKAVISPLRERWVVDRPDAPDLHAQGNVRRPRVRDRGGRPQGRRGVQALVPRARHLRRRDRARSERHPRARRGGRDRRDDLRPPRLSSRPGDRARVLTGATDPRPRDGGYPPTPRRSFMSSTQAGSNGASGAPPVPLRFEVTLLAVTDVDRAKAFYERLGWRLDADFPLGEHDRIIQFTPPGAPASIQFGSGLTDMAPGSAEGLYLIVEDIEAARNDLIARGAEVSEIWHGRGLGKEGMEPGPDPERASYGSFASFADPDGNRYLMQEIKTRLPGRVGLGDSEALAALLHETSIRHGAFEAAAPAHDWWDWYAAYMDARERGTSEDEAVGSRRALHGGGEARRSACVAAR